MIRTIIQLTEEQHRTLKEMAAEYNVSVSEMVRRGVEMLAQSKKPAISPEERRRRLMSIVGIAHDIAGATDVSVNHDRYLAEIYAEEFNDADEENLP